jgi:hypothetical protein
MDSRSANRMHETAKQPHGRLINRGASNRWVGRRICAGGAILSGSCRNRIVTDVLALRDNMSLSRSAAMMRGLAAENGVARLDD